jgi:multicomponent Na+:H+ antiporter subunit A
VSAARDHGPATGPTHLWLAAIPLALFLLLAWGLVRHPLPWQLDAPWVPSLDVSLAFRIDGLSALMLALITGVGTWIFVYASGYLAHEPRRGRLFAMLLLFMLAMIGAVSADNVIVLFLFWELTSITSFLLVGFQHRHSHARSAARQALLITMGGGLALLGGLTLLAHITNGWTLSGIVAAAPAHLEDPRLPYALLLVLLGAFTKSAQFPFHFWLPNAMSAPTPVSAYLHSATMVKLGIYLMARLDPAFNDLPLWEATLVATGTVTAVSAGVLALRERDLKRILARSTVSALGTLTLLVGLPNPGAGLAVAAFLFAHAMYKAPLFMVAGNVDHATGTRIIDHLMGLRRAMPWTAVAAVLAGLSMAGLPLSFGFVAKDVMSVAKAEAEVLALVSYATVFVNAISVAVAGVAAVRVFWGPPEAPRGRVHEVSWRMLLPPLAIVLLGMEFDFVPTLADPLLLAAAHAISPGLGTAADLSASYGLDVLLSATGITVVVGLVFFLSWDWLHRLLQKMHWLDRYGPAAAYELLLRGLSRLAAWQTRGLQRGRLSGYLRLSLATLLAMSAFAWFQGDARVSFSWDWQPQGWAWLVAGLLMVVGAAAAWWLRDRLAVLMASGLVGYGSAALFLFAGAPDLAFTQFAVETILVVVAASVLPRYGPAPTRPPIRALDLALAAGAGIGTLLLLLHLNALPAHSQLADWFATNSLAAAHGRNVVNVIIVDFRALDTLGEIAVVAFSLLAALPLLAGLGKERAP